MAKRAIRCLLAGALAWAGTAAAQGAPERCLENETEEQCQRRMQAGQSRGASMQQGSDVRGSQQQDAPEPAAQGTGEKAEEAGSKVKQGAERAADATAEGAEKAGSAVSGAVSEAVGREEPAVTRPGYTTGGEIDNTITTNPLGWFIGDGVNAEYSRAFEDKVAGVAGARFARTDADAGDATKFGFTAGADYFLLGRNNEGFRVGPRLNFDFSDTEAGDTDAEGGRFGAAAEAGYNWISSGGVTAQAAVGWEERLAGAVDADDDEDRGSRDGAYVKLNLGFSW